MLAPTPPPNTRVSIRALLCFAVLVTLVGGGCERREEPTAAPKSVTVRLVHGPELRAYLSSIKEQFHAAYPTLSDGTKIAFELIPEIGVVAARKIASGEIKSEGWLAPSTSLVNLTNASLVGLGAEQTECIPLFTSPIVIATRPENREFFNTSTDRFSWRELFEGKLAQSAENPDTSYLAYSHAAPEGSVTGIDAVLLLAYLASNQSSPLTASALESGGLLKRLARFENVVSNYSLSETFLLERTARASTKRIRFTVTTEQQLALYNDNRRPETPALIGLYPEEGSVQQNYQLCRSNADWVTPAHQVALRLFSETLQSAPGQEGARMRGFRLHPLTPSDEPTTVTTANPPSEPTNIFPPADGAAVRLLLDRWSDLKRPAALAIVVDNSGSMEGENLRLSKELLRNLLARLPERDLKALLSFSTTAKVEARFSSDSGAVIQALEPIQALGGSAVYDGIRAAIELMAAPDLRGFRKSILVITDGQDKNSESTLQGLIDLINTKLSQYDINLLIIGIDRDEADLSDLEKISKAANGLFRKGPVHKIPELFQEVQKNL